MLNGYGTVLFCKDNIITIFISISTTNIIKIIFTYELIGAKITRSECSLQKTYREAQKRQIITLHRNSIEATPSRTRLYTRGGNRSNWSECRFVRSRGDQYHRSFVDSAL